MATPLKIAVIPGDGTGPEVTAEALKVLAAVSKLEKFTYETQQFDWGGERFLKSGETLPSLHSSGFAPDRERTIKTATTVMTLSALELLAKPNAPER